MDHLPAAGKGGQGLERGLAELSEPGKRSGGVNSCHLELWQLVGLLGACAGGEPFLSQLEVGGWPGQAEGTGQG